MNIWKGSLLAAALALAAGFATSVQAVFIVDDFNTSNLYACHDPIQGGDFCAPTLTPIDSTNTVWDSLGGGPEITRSISASLENDGDGVAIEICDNCQTAHLVSDAGLVFSLGEFEIEWDGPAVVMDPMAHDEWWFSFEWSSDLPGATWFVTIGDFTSAVDTLGTGETARVDIPDTLTSFTSISLRINGVPGLDADIDNVMIEHVAIPEPSTLALFGIGLVGLGFARRRIS